jgi:ABC-type multidrug transport system fused ATPase/permease subunit
MFTTIKNSIYFLRVILPKNLKIDFLIFVILNFIGSVLEVLSIWLIIPLLSLLIDKSKNNWIFSFIESIGFKSSSNIETLRLIFFVFMFFSVISIVYRIIITQKKYNLIYNDIFSYISLNIMNKFLHLPYAVKRDIPDSDFIALFSSKIESVCSKFFLASINLFTNILYLFLLIIVAIVIAPTEVLYAILIFLFYYLFIAFIRPFLVSQGENINLAISKLVKLSSYSYQNFVENRVYGFENRVMAKLASLSKTFGKSFSKNLFYSELPRQILEFLLIVAVVGYFYINSNNFSIIAISLPRIIALGIIMQKLLPVVQIVYSSFSSMISSSSMMLEIISRMKGSDDVRIKIDEATLASGEIQGFSFIKVSCPEVNIGGKKLRYSTKLEIFSGDKITLIGRSGTGKSTLALAIMGFYDSSDIHLTLKQNELQKVPLFNLFGYSGQKSVVFEGSIFENITLKLEKDITDTDILRVKEILDGLLLDYLLEEKNGVLKQKTSLENLSGGELQRISLARIIFLSREINIIDEGTSALDSKTEEFVLDYLLKELDGKTILFISHSKSVIERIKNSVEVK